MSLDQYLFGSADHYRCEVLALLFVIAAGVFVFDDFSSSDNIFLRLTRYSYVDGFTRASHVYLV